MATLPIKGLGSGRVTNKNASQLAPGEARDSLNIIHGHSEECRLRKPIGRVNATRAANAPVLAIMDLVKQDASRIKLQKTGSSLYTFTNTFASTPSSIMSGMSSTFVPGYATANGYMFIADSTKNFSSDGTSSGSNELQLSAPSNALITLASAGTATGNAAGTVYYAYTRVNLYDAAESPPCAAKSVTRTADQGVTVSDNSLVFTTPWTTMNLYRTKAGETQFYRVTTGLTSGSFPYADTGLDSALSTVSEVHGDNVITASIEKPEAAKHCCFHRGRLFLANLTSLPSRVRWSKIIEPTQYSTSTDARFDVGKFDGQEITGLVSFRGSLIVFKTHSIWIMNGGDEETNFVFAPVVKGIGCIAPRSIQQDGDKAIYFLSAQGVHRFDLGQLPELALSDSVSAEFEGLNVTSRGDYFCAGINPGERTYQVSVAPTGVSTNTKTHHVSIATEAWGRLSYLMGVQTPSCYSSLTDSPVVNSDGEVRLYMGTEDGYVYMVDAVASGADGEPSGDVAGTITGYVDGTGVITCSGAAFMTTGNANIGNSATLIRAADGSRESKIITASTATTITTASDWTTDPVVDDTILIGAIQNTIYFGRFTADSDARKRFVRISAHVEKQTHTYPLKFGYVLDGDTAPTDTNDHVMSDYIVRRPVHRRGTGLSAYFDLVGVDHAFELLSLEVEFEILGNRRRPAR